MPEVIKITDGYRIERPVVHGGPWIVTNPEGRGYRVNFNKGTCECGSFYDPRQPAECKHLRAVRHMVGVLTPADEQADLFPSGGIASRDARRAGL